MNATTIDLALSADHVKALRNADDVSFRSDHLGVMRTSHIRATKRVDPRDGFGVREHVVEIPCSVKWTIYERDGSSGRLVPDKAYWCILSCKFCPEWVTFTQHIKAGDGLVLHWTSEGSNLARDLGLRLLTFGIEVRRNTGKKEVRHSFMLEARVENTSSDLHLSF